MQRGPHYRYLKHRRRFPVSTRERRHQEGCYTTRDDNGMTSGDTECSHHHVSLILPTHEGRCPLCQEEESTLASSPTCAATTRAARDSHAYCAACWHKWLQRCEMIQHGNGDGTAFVCPTCRQGLPLTMVAQLLGRSPHTTSPICHGDPSHHVDTWTTVRPAPGSAELTFYESVQMDLDQLNQAPSVPEPDSGREFADVEISFAQRRQQQSPTNSSWLLSSEVLHPERTITTIHGDVVPICTQKRQSVRNSSSPTCNSFSCHNVETMVTATSPEPGFDSLDDERFRSMHDDDDSGHEQQTETVVEYGMGGCMTVTLLED